MPSDTPAVLEPPRPEPIAHLLEFAPNLPAPRCPHCAGTKELVPPAAFWYACRRCFPATFTRN